MIPKSCLRVHPDPGENTMEPTIPLAHRRAAVAFRFGGRSETDVIPSGTRLCWPRPFACGLQGRDAGSELVGERSLILLAQSRRPDGRRFLLNHITDQLVVRRAKGTDPSAQRSLGGGRRKC